MTCRKLTESDVRIEIIITDNDQGPRENYAVPGIVDPQTPEADTFVADVSDMIDKHGLWGWCQVEVKVSFMSLTASDYLSGCSYIDEEDFKKDGYYQDMVERALDGLQDQVQDIFDALNV